MVGQPRKSRRCNAVPPLPGPWQPNSLCVEEAGRLVETQVDLGVLQPSVKKDIEEGAEARQKGVQKLIVP